MDSYFATCGPGLETLLSGELAELGLVKPRLLLGPPAEPGGVSFEGDAAALCRAVRRLSVAERVLVRHGPYPAGDFAALERSAALVPWERYLAPGAALAVRVETRASKLYHEKGVAERVARGASLRLKAESALAPFDEEKPGALAYISVDADAVTVGVDASGAALHRRGWRLDGAKAPLRETLAAALVRASGWDRHGPLLDPFCGSGTIVIEAALAAAGVSAGAMRRFALQAWPSFDAAAWAREGVVAAFDAKRPRIIASDRDAGAVAAARANAERAGVAEAIEFSVRAVSAVEPPPGPGWVVTNPPYGVRVGEGKDLRDLYAAFGRTMRDKCGGWDVCLLAPMGPLAPSAGLRLEAGLSTLNGGLSVRVWRARA